MPAPLVFGLFPLGLAGSPDGVASGPPDDFEQIGTAVMELQGDGPPLLPRMYVLYDGDADAALAQVEQLTSAPELRWDLVLCYRSASGDVAGWCDFVATVVERHGRALDSIQVTGEPNLTTVPAAADGAFPRALEALVDGVLRAAEVKRACGASAAIGFAVATDPNPQSSFWADVRTRGGDAFAAALDYAGIDMYPDVFGGRIAPERLADAVGWVLRDYRERALAAAGVPASVPIRVCECGWPTGPDRSEADQARALATIVRAVADAREPLNVTHWELFTLRDADSTQPGLFHNFGVLRSDYSRKPAFAVLRGLIAELGR